MRRSARLKAVLTDPPRKPGQRCRCCALPDLSEAVRLWAKARADGGPSLNAFWEGWVLRSFPVPPSFGSLRGHVLRCEGLDNRTGRSLR